ncbi:piggyBac transposable element-derived protein 4-like [Dysidea avara]|uniref:piggyBac transposable element-derived protein 4-like n=1 Tax=Dysidea avara TaxID=196820 RepID=UPI00332D7D80
MPKFTKKLKRGEIDYYHSDELLALTWHDKRDVRMLSTVHTPVIVDTNKVHHKTKETICKPQCVTDYINSMGAVDKSDMQISLAECVRKTRKWYKKLVFHLIDMAMYNAYILYQHNIGKKHSFYKFKPAAAKQIIQAHSFSRETSGRPRSSGESPLCLTGQHFPSRVPERAQGSRTRRRCHVCQHTTRKTQHRTDTKYMCVECNVALCAEPCFMEYHTKLVY